MISAINWTTFSQLVLVTFGHFLWQGAVIGACLKLGLSLTNQSNANLRYWLACTAMSLLPIAVLFTFGVLFAREYREALLTVKDLPALRSGLDGRPQVDGREFGANSRAANQESQLVDDGPIQFNTPNIHSQFEFTSEQPNHNWERFASRMSPWLIGAYLICVIGQFARLGASQLRSRRLIRNVSAIQCPEILSLVLAEAKRYQLRTLPKLAECEQIMVPVVVGVLQPIILIPPVLATRFDRQQLAALLSHELAHIYRFDVMVNLVQRALEAVLFFHPTTWWISKTIRRERENACDDLASATYGAVPYAAALLNMAECCLAKDSKRLGQLTVMAADGSNPSDLGIRIRRLLGDQNIASVQFFGKNIALGLVGCLCISASLFAWGANKSSNQVTPEQPPSSPEPAVQLFSPEPTWVRTGYSKENSLDEIWFGGSSVEVVANSIVTKNSVFDVETGKRLTDSVTSSWHSIPKGWPKDYTPIIRRRSLDRKTLAEVGHINSNSNTFVLPSYIASIRRCQDGALLGELINIPNQVFGKLAIDISSDGSELLAVGDDSSLTLFSISDGSVLETLRQFDSAEAVAFSPSASEIVISRSNKIHIYNYRSRTTVQTIDAHRKVDHLSFTPDGQFFIAGPDTRDDIQVYDSKTGELAFSLRDEVTSPLSVNSLDISPNGCYLAAQNQIMVSPNTLTIPHRVHVWDLNTRKLVFQVATEERVRKVAFSEDGRLLIGETYSKANGSTLAAWRLPIAPPFTTQTSVKSLDDQTIRSGETNKRKPIRIRIVDQMTKQPLAGIKVDFLVRNGERNERTIQVSSDTNGLLEIELQAGETSNIQRVSQGWFLGQTLVGFASDPQANRTAEDSTGSASEDDDEADTSPSEPQEIGLFQGQEVAGRLLWPDGSPAAGVHINAGVYVSHTTWRTQLGMGNRFVSWDHGEWPNWLRRATTNQNGDFMFTVPPSDARMWLRVGTTAMSFSAATVSGIDQGTTQRLAACVPFVMEIKNDPSGTQTQAALHLSNLSLQRGYVFQGIVLDAEGNPLSDVRLTSSGEYGPHSGPSTISQKDGRFEFAARGAGEFTIHPDARLRNDAGKVISENVQAVFVRQAVKSTKERVTELVIRAVPHTELNFNWLDKRSDTSQPVAYYGGFRIRG